MLYCAGLVVLLLVVDVVVGDHVFVPANNVVDGFVIHVVGLCCC